MLLSKEVFQRNNLKHFERDKIIIFICTNINSFDVLVALVFNFNQFLYFLDIWWQIIWSYVMDDTVFCCMFYFWSFEWCNICIFTTFFCRCEARTLTESNSSYQCSSFYSGAISYIFSKSLNNFKYFNIFLSIFFFMAMFKKLMPIIFYF